MARALARYLRHARPHTDVRKVFFALTAPSRPLNASAISSVVRSRMQRCDIKCPRRGAHALRHAFAQRLLDEGFLMQEIGDCLGHRSLGSTAVYAKVVWVRAKAIRRPEAVRVEPQPCGQHGELFSDESAERPERGIGLEACAHRADFGDAARKLLGEQADDDAQDVVNEPHPALNPAHRSGELDRVTDTRRGAVCRMHAGLGRIREILSAISVPVVVRLARRRANVLHAATVRVHRLTVPPTSTESKVKRFCRFCCPIPLRKTKDDLITLESKWYLV